MKFNKMFMIAVLLLVSLSLTGGILTSEGAQQEIDLQKGLVAYWSFDEGEGDIVFDESGNHNDGVLKCAGEDCSPPKWVEGKVGYALEFDGEDDYVEVADSQVLDITEEITIAVWIRPKRVLPRTNFIGKTSQGGSYRLILWNRRIYFQLSLDGKWGGNWLVSSSTIPLHKWTHILLHYDGSVRKIFVHGKEDITQKIEGHIDTSKSSLRIGFDSFNSPFEGILDEVRIYNRVLTVREVNILFEQRSE